MVFLDIRLGRHGCGPKGSHSLPGCSWPSYGVHVGSAEARAVARKREVEVGEKVQHSRFSLPGAIPGFSARGLSGEARGKVHQMHARRLKRRAMQRHFEDVKKYANSKSGSRKRCTTQATKTPLSLREERSWLRRIIFKRNDNLVYIEMISR